MSRAFKTQYNKNTLQLTTFHQRKFELCSGYSLQIAGEHMPLTRRDLVIGTIFLVSIALLIGTLSMRNGPNIAPDEAHFVGYALGVQQGRGLTMLSAAYDSAEISHTIAWWPPLYPLLLTLVSLGGDPRQGLIFMGYIGLVATALLMALLAYRVLGSRFHAIAAALFLISIYGLISPASRGAVETVFIPLVLGVCILALDYQFGVPVTSLRRALILLVLLAAGALIRNLMFVITLALCAYLLLWAWSLRGQHVRPSPYWHIVIVAASVIPFGLFSLYNGIVNDNPLGMHRLVSTFKLDDINNAIVVLSHQSAHGVRTALSMVGLRQGGIMVIGRVLIIVLPIVLLVRFWFVRKQRPPVVTAASAFWLVTLVTIIYAVVYLGITAFMPYSFPEAARYLMPSFIGFILWVLMLSRRLKIPRVIEIVVVALYVYSGITVAAVNTGRGVSFNIEPFREDWILQRLADFVPDDAILIGGEYAYRHIGALPTTPIRTGPVDDNLYFQLRCDQMVYPAGYPHVAMILLGETPDDVVVLDRTPEQRVAFLTAWFAPCGVVESFETSDVTTLAIGILNDEFIQ